MNLRQAVEGLERFWGENHPGYWPHLYPDEVDAWLDDQPMNEVEREELRAPLRDAVAERRLAAEEADQAAARWRSQEESAKAAAAARAAEAERNRARDERRADERRKEQETIAAATREAFASSAKDATWVRGEDPASLRAVAAWLAASGSLVAFVPDETVRDGLAGPRSEFQRAIATRLAEIAAADALNRDVVRRARGEPQAATPAPFDVGAFVDPDAVARWLVAHEGAYSLQVGRWESVERTRWESDGDAGLLSEGKAVLYQARELRQPGEWDVVESRCERWAAWARAEREAQAHPGDAAALRARGLDALTGQGAEWLVEEELGAWSFEPPDAAEPELRRRAPGRADVRVGEVTNELAAVAAYRKFTAAGIRPSGKAIGKTMRAAGAKGQDRALVATYKAVEAHVDEFGVLPP